MAKRFKKGDTAYVPVTIDEVEHENRWYDYVVRTPAVDGVKAEFPFCVADEEIKTAEEVAGLLKTKADAMTVTADSLQKENEELKTQIAELQAERDKFAKTAKDKADLANKACDERNDVQGDLETAKAIVGHLQEENKKLKQEIKDAEATYNVVADTSIKRKNRATTMEEVIVALVEKIRRLEGEN